MAAAKKEIYARLATQLLTHERCTIAEEECNGAMGLYVFLVMQARHAKTHGETHRGVALASWGAPKTYRAKQSAALILAGLVEEREGKLVVIRYLDHNDGPEEIAAAKERANIRQDRKRHPEKHAPVTRDTTVTGPVTTTGFPYSYSYSSSLSGSGSADHRSDLPPQSPPAAPANDNDPPAWWAAACDTVAASVAPVDDRGARWLEYSAARERKGWAVNQRDAVGWLSTVVRSERTRAPASRRVDTRQPLTGPEPEWLTRAKSTGTDGTEPF